MAPASSSVNLVKSAVEVNVSQPVLTWKPGAGASQATTALTPSGIRRILGPAVTVALRMKPAHSASVWPTVQVDRHGAQN